MEVRVLSRAQIYFFIMLYTRKGDSGTTKTFGCDQRISKSSAVAEALGTLDEINSFLGICKVRSAEAGLAVASGETFEQIVGWVQQNLFIIQAELAGADKVIGEDKVKKLESLTDGIEAELPPITSFFVSGGTELGATFDVARTIARRAERRVVESNEQNEKKLGAFTLPFLNRLSSLLYALA